MPYITLGWSATNNPSTFILSRDDAGVVYEGAATTFKDTTVASGVNYTYTLIAQNSNGVSSEPRLVSASVDLQPFPVSTFIVSASGMTDSSIDLSWGDVGQAGVTYEGILTDGTTPINFSTVDQLGKTVVGLKPNTVYNVTITAKKDGFSNKTTTTSFKTTNANFGSFDIQVANVTDNGATLSWTNLGSSVVYKGTVSATGATTIEIQTTSTNYPLTGLVSGRSYNVHMVASKVGYNDAPATATFDTGKANFESSMNVTNEVTGQDVTLNWNNVNAGEYKVEIQYPTGTSWSTISSGTQMTTTKTVYALTPGVTYKAIVTAKKSGYNDMTETSTFTIPFA